MTVLVTGATGFLGGALVRRLLDDGERSLVCLARPGPKGGRIAEVAARYPGAEVETVVGNLVDPAVATRAVRDVSVVYHLAAGLTGATADLFLNTVVTTKHLLEAALAAPHKPRVVLVSSFGVYGVAALGRGALVDESTPLETAPARRDPYSQAKLRQEKLAWEYAARGLPLSVLRPGVIYGPGGSPISSRVGLSLFGTFLFLGGDNLLPLTYVDNCADAIALAGRDERALGQIYNVVDDDLPTCAQFLKAYERNVRKLRKLRLPFGATLALGALVERYHAWSRGQLPAVFTPYKVRTSWGGNRFSNDKLKGLGWQPRIATGEGLDRTFSALRGAA